ncbi:major facilitator superfamily transporter [Colletotrichum falcatum]|nr:major facilitator superfamily transporter [Colletotrichum falcatum]
MAECAGAHAGHVIPPKPERHPVRWNRSTFYNMTILGLCNLAAPGIWGAMNSLGAGGAASPRVVNAANALTFCLMVVSCYFSSAIVHYIGIKDSAAIAIAYPEPWNRGKALGYWLTYRLCGQILGGAINLGLNAGNDQAGKVSYTVFIVFIAIQAAGPLVGLFLNKPDQVERQDGQRVSLAILGNPWHEIKATTRNLLTPKFLLIFLWIGQAVFAEAVFFTYLATWFSVRSRALGSFLSGIVAVISGNLLGHWLDRAKVSLRTRTRSTFWALVVTQGAWWLWATILATRFRETRPTHDWASPGFGAAFAVYIFLTIGFQLNYLFLYFIVTNLAKGEEEVIRYAALLRGVESAWQAVSYGLTSLTIFGEVGGIYFNFALWAVAIGPAWLVLRHFGSGLKAQVEEVREGDAVATSEDGELNTKQQH